MAIKTKLYPQNSEEVLYPETSIDQVKGMYKHTIKFDVNRYGQYENAGCILVFTFINKNPNRYTVLQDVLSLLPNICDYIITDYGNNEIFPVMGFLNKLKANETTEFFYYRLKILYSDNHIGGYTLGPQYAITDTVEEL